MTKKSETPALEEVDRTFASGIDYTSVSIRISDRKCIVLGSYIWSDGICRPLGAHRMAQPDPESVARYLIKCKIKVLQGDLEVLKSVLSGIDEG